MKQSVWITWESHRRSKELAKAFGAELITIDYSDASFWRYPLSIIKTIIVLFKKRPNILFVQNPSIILTTLASLLKPVFQYDLIVDRHSNFRFSTMNSSSFKWRVFHMLSKCTVKQADLTIVTVESLKKLVNEWQGRGAILQDKIPKMIVNKADEKSEVRGLAALVPGLLEW